MPRQTEEETNLRQKRFRDLGEKMSQASCVVIGCGAIGRQVAMQLAVMGVATLDLYDPGDIEEVNLGTQGWSPLDEGKPKAQVLAEEIEDVNPDVIVGTVIGTFKVSPTAQNVADTYVFMCVDSMEARTEIFQAIKKVAVEGAPAHLFIDARMTMEAARILVVDNLAADEYYQSTLFADRDALADGCTTKSTFYCASLAASLMVTQFAKHLRGIETDRDMTIDLRSMELFPTTIDTAPTAVSHTCSDSSPPALETAAVDAVLRSVTVCPMP